MGDLTQSGRLIRIYTTLGDDVLVPRSFDGSEGISRLYEYRVDLASESATINATDIVGKRATLSILQSDMETERYFDGFVSHFTKLPRRPPHHAFYEYELTLVPWTWFLTRTTNCRIFQEMSVPQVIEQIFQDLGFTDFQTQLSGTHNPWTYCVQYRETAFNFISRLMEQEGIYYFFKHEKGKHTMVLIDKNSAHQNCDFQATMRMEPSTGSYARDEDTVQLWERHYHYRSGKWAQTDYNFETPTTSLLTNEATVLQIEKNTNYEFFEYPGEYDSKGDGEPLTKLRMEEEEIGFDTARGEGDCRSFLSGYKFTLQDHDQKDQNQTYVLQSVTHKGHQGGLYAGETEPASYRNSFECFPASVQFRPPRITPSSIVHGTQTAVVVGPSGEEIYTDQYGRVKVQFFWDRLGQKNEKSSCWIRVSQPWAGKNWGGIWIPRIGQEVVVDFLEGDPDRPLIVGRVYNEQQGVPYTLPDISTQSGFLSRSSKNGGTANFNELRFEDKMGSEEIFLQAEKDLNIIVEHDQSRTVQHDETVTISNDRTEQVGNNETGSIGSNRQWTISSNDQLTVSGNQTVTISGNQSITVSGSISITANAQITLTCGANTITMGPSGISIQGSPIVEIN